MKTSFLFFLIGKGSPNENCHFLTHFSTIVSQTYTYLPRSKYVYFIFITFLFPWCLQAQDCGGANEELLIETSLLTGQVCENSTADVSVTVTPESFYMLNEIDSIQWGWYENSSLSDIIPGETTFPPFGMMALNDHLYDETLDFNCSQLESLITPPNRVDLFIQTKGFVTCDNDEVETHTVLVGFELLLRPRTSLSIMQSTICIDETTSFINTGCFGDANMSFWTVDGTEIQNGGIDIIDYSPTGVGTIEVCLHLVNNCGEDVDCKTLTVVPEPDAEFDIPTELLDGVGCAGTYEFCNISDTINALNREYYWGVYFNGNLQGAPDTVDFKNCFSDGFNTPGSYQLVLTATNFVCDTAQYSFDFTIVPSSSAILADPGSFCVTEFTGYTPDISYNGDISNYAWTFENGTPTTSSDPFPVDVIFPIGTHDVDLIITSACGSLTYQTTVTIDEETEVTFSPIEDAYCTGQGDTLKIIPSLSGGTWNSNLFINDSCIAIDNLPIGPNTFTYSAGVGACLSSGEITINVRDTTAIQLNISTETFCADDGIVAITAATPTGGTWSGIGVVDPINGTVDPDIIGSGNTSIISYSFLNSDGCISTANKSIVIEGLPEASLPQDTLLLCEVPGLVDLSMELDIQLLTDFSDEWIGNCTTPDGQLDPVCLGIGSFTLEYIIFTPNGCTDTTDITIIIDEFQEANAGEDLSECVSDGATITLIGTPAGGTWEGTNISLDGIITINETMEGDFDYTYFFGGANCQTQDVVTVTIINLNDLSASLPDYCETDGVVTLPDGTPAGGTWTYQGNILPNNELDITNLGPGNFMLFYEVEVITSNNEVCSNAVPVDLFVDALPNPVIEIPDDLCINVVNNIINNTTEVYTTWNWDFGNGTTATGLAPSFEYTMTGDYIITLNIQDTVCQQTFTWDVSVSAPPPPLDFALNILSVDSCELLEVAFINQSQVDDNITDIIYIWNFGNGMMDTTFSVNEAPDNIFFEAFEADTIYTVTLSALNNCGDVIPVTDSVFVKPKPISQFSADFEVYCSGATVNFVNASVGNPENTIIDLGDGSPLLFDYPFDTLRHQYFVGNGSEMVTVRFISTNSCGSDTISFSLEIVPVDVVAGFTVENNGVFCQNTPFCLENGATPGATVWYDMGDGNTLFASDTCYAYTEANDYTITQFSLDVCGGLDTLQIPVSVSEAPTIAINSVNEICLGDSIDFQLTISADVVDVNWDFGDGNTSDQQNPTHIFQTPGIYSVTATASSVIPCAMVSTTTVTVAALLPVSFVMKDSVCVDEIILLENTTNGSGFSCLWTIDETIVEPGCNLEIAFANSGIHTLSLTLTENTTGCKNTKDSTLFVRPTPTSAFTIQRVDDCIPNVFQFINQSSDANTAFWDFGDETTATLIDSVEHIYTQPGTYQVSLLSSFDGICFDTLRQTIEVPESLNAVMDILDLTGCEPFSPNIQNQSTGTNLVYQWSTSTGLNFFGEAYSPVFSTNLPAEDISIQLIVLDSITNCADTSNMVITVFDSPTTALNFDPVTCPSGSDGEINVSATGGSPGYQYDWSIAGDTETLSNLLAGIYTVTVTDINNCVAIDTAEITQPDPILIALENLENATCAGREDGIITVEASGGTTTTGNEFIYEWNIDLPQSSEPFDAISELAAGFYSVTVTDESGCTEMENYEIEDGYLLGVTDTAIGISCAGLMDGQIRIVGIENGIPNFLAVLEGPASDTLNSDTGILEFKNLPEGIYNLAIIDQNNCAFENEYLVPSWQDPQINIYTDKPELLRCDSALVLANATGGMLSYDWFPMVNLTCLNEVCDSVKVSPENDITYELIVSDERGCMDSDTVSFNIDEDRTLFIPNAFTPNGDGNNDIFRIRVGAHQEFLLSEIKTFNVLDRWGNVLFNAENFHPFLDPAIGWDGTIDETKAPSDIYLYWAELIFCDGQKEIIKGHIQLIR